MLEACRDASSPTPEFRYEETGLWVEFPFKSAETTQETSKEKIIALIKSRPTITSREMSKALGLTMKGIHYHLNNLKSAGVIRHIGPTKTGLWEILK